MPRPNASIVLSGRDRNTPTPRNYNSAVFSQTNQNIVQGQIYSVAVSEVNFPYDIPNVQLNVTDEFLLTNLDNNDQLLFTVLNPGFYTGTELATQLNNAIAAEAATVGVNPSNIPTVEYDDTTNVFSMAPPAAPFAPQAWIMTSSFTFPGPGISANPLPTNKLGKDLPSMMGFLPTQGNPVLPTFPGVNALYIVNVGYTGPSVIPPGIRRGEIFAAQSAPLIFTQYIDICSPQLCKFQYFRDGSTTNLARRSDVICRLYIANNIAIGEAEGTRPFLINRQYQNPRVMRWTADNAIGQIDINLYDDVGQPLLTAWEPRPYQLTFLAYELEKD